MEEKNITAHHKNIYHPLFILLYVMNLLPKEVIQTIPPNTRKNWNKKILENSVGFQFCAIYIKHFDDVVFAHKHIFTRQVLSVTIEIQKTFLAITQNSILYKKLLRTQAENIVNNITAITKKGVPLTTACKLFGLKVSWYQYHKRKIICPKSQLRSCFKQKTTQLTYNEQKIIENHIKDEKNKGQKLVQLYYQLLTQAKLFCSLDTFKIYAYKSGYKKRFQKPKAGRKKGFRAEAIFEYLHIDTTFQPTKEDSSLKVAIVRDNYSKAPLHRKIIDTNLNSKFIKELLEETFEKYKLFDRTHEINIISDGGSENKGEVINWIGNIKAPPFVKKIIAGTLEFKQSNSMIEGLFHLFKHDFLNGELIINKQHLEKKLDIFFDHTLNRYFTELYGLTPQQILDAEIIDRHRFKNQIKQAKENRKAINKAFKCNAIA
jgi:hypothetical protein